MKMREFKFRAWVLKDEALDGLMENTMEYDVESFHDPLYEYKRGNIILMQYTGLEDKNGRELYELDITKDKFGNLDVICWVNSSGAYATVPINLYLEGEYEYTVVDEFGTDCFFENNAPGDFLEVIGNIYENPELLEESE